MTQHAEPLKAGEDAPQPTFDALPLSPDVRRAIDALGYVNPTPVQLAVFEPATRGRSLVVQARTGTGKTAAFGLPIIDSLVRKSQANVQALVLTPTRELALQVSRECERIAEFRGVKIIAIYGGAPMGRQITALEEGAQVVVGTPGRVLDHLRRGTFDPSNVRIFVLDEADEMLSMGFAKELNAIIETLPEERQGLYFSATIPPDVERLANNHLKDPEYVTLSSDQVGALEIAHYVYLVQGDKRAALARVIETEDPESAIVFCNTRDETERLAELLKSRGYDADWLNGDLPQSERENVMRRTREGKLRFLVATDVAARGIDISHLTHVINVDFPESAEQYVHRTGRTGRAGRTGTAISMVGPKDVGHLYMLRLTYKIRPIERSLPSQGELRTRTEADLVGFLAEAYADKTPDPLSIAVAKRLLTHDAAETILAGLVADHLGARGTSDVTQEAADARRAKNPPPEPPPRERERERDERPQGDRGRDDRGRGGRGERSEARGDLGPRTTRGGETEARPDRPDRGPPRDRDRGARDRGGRDRDRGGRGDRDRPPRDRDSTPGYTVSDAPAEPTVVLTAPTTLRDGERPGRAKPAAAPRVRREGVPQASLSDWEPPADDDDDSPILVDGERSSASASRVGEARSAERSSASASRVGEARSPERPAKREALPREAAPARGGREPRGGRRGGGRASPVSPIAIVDDVNATTGARERSDRESGIDDAVTATEAPDHAVADTDRPPKSGGSDEIGPDFQNLFLNIGRRDGVKPTDLQQMLVDLGGLAEADIGRIHIRDRIAFVAVKKEQTDRAIRALVGQIFGGRTISAEPARSRD